MHLVHKKRDNGENIDIVDLQNEAFSRMFIEDLHNFGQGKLIEARSKLNFK